MTDDDTAALLRLEVGRLRTRETHRRFDPVVHVGQLGGPHRRSPVPAGDPVLGHLLDPGTRAEVVSGLLEGLEAVGPSVSAWLMRVGEPVVQDEDLAWLSATTHALGSFGLELEGFWTVTRTGWLDVRSGESRTWKRLRL